jgi:catechol 2,3-dioxygenase-like lactoylglutathione lyase family enzyme
MARYLHTMYRITDPDRSRAFYEALGFDPAASCRSSVTANSRQPTTSWGFPAKRRSWS